MLCIDSLAVGTLVLVVTISVHSNAYDAYALIVVLYGHWK